MTRSVSVSSEAWLHGPDERVSRSEVVFSKNGQPFLIAGSGTLGWDQVYSLTLRYKHVVTLPLGCS